MSDDLDNLQKCLLECQNNDLRSRNVSHTLLHMSRQISYQQKKKFHKLCNSISLQDSHGFYRLATSSRSVRENWYLAHVSNFPLGIQSISQLKTVSEELERYSNIAIFQGGLKKSHLNWQKRKAHKFKVLCQNCGWVGVKKT